MPSRRGESAAEGSRRRSRGGSSHNIATLPILPPQLSGVTKRKREESRPNKRKAHVLVSSDEEKDPFGDDDKDVLDVVDLADTDEVPESMRAKPKPKNEIKLGAFQCVICMDNVTGLTVTHCGEFCLLFLAVLLKLFVHVANICYCKQVTSFAPNVSILP